MKNPKLSSSKPSSSSSHKPHSSSSARKSRWESPSSTPDAAKPPKSSNPKGKSDSKDLPSSSSAALPAPSAGAGPEAPPSLAGPQFPNSTPPSYGFQDLERRTIVLADGSVRSYYALPPDYPLEPFGHGGLPEPGLGFGFERFSPDGFPPREFGPPRGGDFGWLRDLGLGPGRDFGLPRDYWLDGPRGAAEGGPSSMKRKYQEEDEFAWHRQHVSQFGHPNPNLNPHFGESPSRRRYEDELRASKQAKVEGGSAYQEIMPRRGRVAEDLAPAVLDVDPQAMKRAFLKFAKLINEHAGQRKKYLEDGKVGSLRCAVCGRASKDFPDVHGLIMHAYSSQNPDLRIDHLGLHKALCVLMGWNYAKAPENSKAYQSLSADDALTNREDLILWPPTVVIHNTSSGRRKDGRVDGMGNKEMDMKLKDLCFGGGKSKSMYGKEGHLGITLVKFANTQSGLREAECLAEYFEKDNHGRKGWAMTQALDSRVDDEKNPALVKVDPKSGEKSRILYGYLATASDLDKLDFDMRKKAIVKSKREYDPSA